MEVDWPRGRAVIIEKHKNYCILINEEEHVEIVVHRSKDVNFFRVRGAIVLSLTWARMSITCSIWSYRWCVSSISWWISVMDISQWTPSTWGMDWGWRCRSRFPEDRIHIFKINLACLNIKCPYLEVNEVDAKQGIWKVQNNKTLGFSDLELIRNFKKTISFLLTGVVEPELLTLEEESMLRVQSRKATDVRGETLEFDSSHLTLGNESSLRFPKMVILILLLALMLL